MALWAIPEAKSLIVWFLVADPPALQLAYDEATTYPRALDAFAKVSVHTKTYFNPTLAVKDPHMQS